jgi:hypothetical protein
MGLKEERQARRDRDAAREQRDIAILQMNSAIKNYIDLNNSIPGIKKQERENAMNETTGSINKTINDYLEIKNLFFENQNRSINTVFDALINKTKVEIIDLSNNVSKQNDQLRKQIVENKQNANESLYVKSEYQKLEIEKLVYQNKILWYVFYVLVLVLGVVMFFFNTLSVVAQTIIFHILIVFPFVIYYFELICYIIYTYSKSYFESTPFSNVYLSNY